MAPGTGFPNPVVYVFEDNFNKSITITFEWTAGTRDLVRALVHRDPGCQWEKVYVGLGSDGKPDSTEKVFNVGKLEGEVEFTQAQLRRPQVNLRKVDDLSGLNITAGP